jgi:hypothetical protein
MLVFCMLLALSGTTDFPENHCEGIPSSHAVTYPTGRSQPAQGEDPASVGSPPEVSETLARAPDNASGRTEEVVTRNRPLLLLGVVPVACWILVSFRLFSGARG